MSYRAYVYGIYGSPPFLHKPILHTLGPTQPIQHTIVPSRAYYSTSVILHEAVMYDTGNRSKTRRFCTCFDTARGGTAQPPIHHKPISHVPDSTQPVSTHQFFNTTRFYTSVFQHNPFLHINFSPQSWSCTTVPRFCTRIYLR